jgi:hypothetical protein
MPILKHNSINPIKRFSKDLNDTPAEKNRSDYMHIYQSRQWKYARKSALDETPLCEVCESNGKTTPATSVHHIRPLRTFLDKEKPISELNKKERTLAFGYENLQCLCHSCHAKIEAKEMRNEKKQRQIEADIKRDEIREENKKNITERRRHTRIDNFEHTIAIDENGNKIKIQIF